jgi:hypothetical protein
MKGLYELPRHGRYILPCCFITALFLSACAEQRGREFLLERLVSARGMCGCPCLV